MTDIISLVYIDWVVCELLWILFTFGCTERVKVGLASGVCLLFDLRAW